MKFKTTITIFLGFLILYTLHITLYTSIAFCADPGNPPVAQWRFDEGGGPTAYDEAGAHNGTITGATFVPGKIGKALSFNGTSNKVTAGSITVGTNMTISAWINKNSSTGQKSFFSNRGGGVVYFGLTGTQVFLYNSGGSPAGVTSASGSVTIGQWQHIVATSDGTTTKFYVNGVLINTASQTRTASTGSVGIGWDPSIGTEYWDGLIDDVKLYDYVRSADQVMVDYNAGSAAHLGAGTDPNEGNPPIGYWPLDENTGITTYDRSGNGNDGTLTNSPAWTQGKNGSALTFNGSNANVSIPNSASLGLTNTGTIEAWVYPNSQNYATFYTILNKGDWGAGHNGYRIYHQQNEAESDYRFEISNASGPQVIHVNIIPNMWHYIAMVWNGTQLIGYVDGAQTTSATQNLNVTNDTSALTIGMGSNSLNGNIDDVKIYNYARTQAQVAYDYSRGSPVAHYKFDEGTGTIAHNEYSSANTGVAPVGWWRMDNNWNDSSGYGNNGTANGSPAFSTSAKIGPYCGSFNGTNAYIDCGSGATLNIPSTITIEAWVNPSATAYGYKALVQKGAHNSGYFIRLDGSFAIDTNIAGTWHSLEIGTLTQGVWNYIAVTYDGSQIKHYLNGVLVGSTNFTGTMDASGSSLKIAQRTTGEDSGQADEKFAGTIDDVRIYNYVRTPEQIYNDYKTTQGTMIGTNIKFTDGKIVKALQFNGTDDYVNCGTDSTFNITGPITVEAWTNFSDLSARSIVSKWGDDANSNYSWLLFANLWNSGEVNFLVSGNGTGYTNCASGAGAIIAGNWYHIVGVYDTTTIKLYINGRLITTQSSGVPSSIKVSSIPLQIGVDSDGSSESRIRYFKGSMDDVRIYNYSRTADQVLQDYNAGFSARFGAQSAGTADPWGGVLPIGWWKLDENTGILAQDSSGNGNNGTLTNGPIWTQGMNGPCLNFDGADDFVDCASPGILNFGNNPFSISVWFKNTAPSGYDTIVGKGGFWANDEYQMYTLGGNLHFYVDKGGTKYDTLYGISTNQWYHAVGVYDGSYIKLYVNGIFITQTAASGLNIGNATSFRIGRAGGDPFAGLIDDVRVYNYALSQAQVAWLYNAGAPVAHWKFDEAVSGSAVGSNTIKDNSGNGYHGTGTGSNLSWTTGKFQGALSFNGTNDYVTGNLTSQTISGFTIAGWIKLNAAGNWGAMWTGYSGASIKILARLYGTSVQPNLYTSPGGDMTSTTVLNLGQWYHIAYVYDGSYKRIYINGAQDTSAALSGATFAIDNFEIGRNEKNNAYLVNGLLDDVRFYNYARTADQILQDYNNGASTRLGN